MVTLKELGIRMMVRAESNGEEDYDLIPDDADMDWYYFEIGGERYSLLEACNIVSEHHGIKIQPLEDKVNAVMSSTIGRFEKINAVRNLLGCGLTMAKNFVDGGGTL